MHVEHSSQSSWRQDDGPKCVLRAQVQEGVRTLSVRVGIPRVFWACIGMLEAAYFGAICMGFASQVRLGDHNLAVMGIAYCARYHCSNTNQALQVCRICLSRMLM